MFYVYVLWSSKIQKHYTGQTDDWRRRLEEHNNPEGPHRFTQRGIPWQVVYYEECATRQEAIRREKFLKSGAGRAWLKKQIP